MQTNIQAGFAEVDWTPPAGLPVIGQMHERIATHMRDPLYACAAALRSTETTVVLVTVDVCGVTNEFATAIQAAWAQRTGLAPGTLLIHATHTHVAPAPAAIEAEFQSAVLDAAARALENLEDVELFASTGYLEHMGWNRRAMFEDGSTRMYGHSKMPGFIGMEGPRDGALPLIWARNARGEVAGVIVSFSTHPNTLESECFYSADIPGAVRKYLKRALGEKTGVLYLTGAAGNTAPSQLDPVDLEQRWRGERGLERSGQYVAGEALKLIAAGDEPMSNPVLRLQHHALEIPLREWPQPDEPSYPRPDASWRDAAARYDHAREQWAHYLETMSPLPVNVNVLRIGDAAICTNPAELFVEFGLDIRNNSPARVTMISELTDGCCYYVPTAKAFSRGGYETWCAISSPLVHEAGNLIVDKTLALLKNAFAEEEHR